VIAGIVTFFCFAFWITFMTKLGIGPVDRAAGILYSFALVFVLVGWIPLGGGWLAGWVVSKLPDAPAEDAS
jgi:uncharacterized membrane protein required for colicin V production